ncbi:uncharacterized protein TRIVIDRAFT_225823 [Trichoderma virens Gv29-8]|uniref:NACHT domain-containing protein n=1 Tax=Hypocrea virens (strain Gv29-8 / FGSC 10586) TaxID=413071 RepID=G9N4J3_HYPVG|nr:uncharacterized protein TRIVIDRAFT_225823 [Trichoderma virens Gv29-8]EHK18518.1 hypothetical protein TRIVIDRAFT_225823 [Trichoderma virens Gv29-8]UKZ52726.1 hypothetical protein TrVGV298_006510 [Trichoderma virens]
MSSVNDYTVGWICAISTELVAARAFLDEEHDPSGAVSPHDNNVYTLGKMGKHNVVIAALPDGEYGISAAASVARDMLHSFPNVRFGLMVGIGGGVPSNHDIRLGDIVVSATRNGQGGIFQYDFGKTIQAQEFQNIMFLDQPPTLLRSAVGDLKARYESDGHQFQEVINNIFNKKPRLRKKYQRPNPNTDRLYISSAVHPFTNDEMCATACGDSMLVPREPREEYEDDPAIHYGLIASGNQLMKDALIRDELALKKDVLCFEMEAAGLMNHFPCLVIRGICDYSDSHKNKYWQGYAAMTAAAYAKDVLKCVPPNKIEAEQRIGDALSGVKESVDHLIRTQHDGRNLAILNWLASGEYGAQQSDCLRQREQGTGEWLLNSDQFQTWIKGENQMLFCPGIPGAGKTILTSIVIDHLHSHFQEDPKSGIAYFFFNYKRQDQQKNEDLLASLLRQLTARQPSMPKVVQDLYDRHNGQRTRPSTDELMQALQSVVITYSRVFIMIDALDECRSVDHTHSSVLSGIFTLRSKTKANFFLTSRLNANITENFEGIPELKIYANNDDVQRYLRGNMRHLPRFVRDDPGLQEKIITSILKAVQGMFLLARFHLDSLKGKTKPKEITNALQKLATGSDAYEQVYNETMLRIISQYKEQAQLAKSVLSWVTFAKRPLTVVELRHALGVEHGESTFDEQNMPDIELMVSVCAGLVTIDNDSNIIRLVHYTAQEYFQQAHDTWLQEPQAEITTTCITYLSYKVFEPETGDKYDDFVACNNAHPLYDYASKYWGYHAREDSVLRADVMAFLEDMAKIGSHCKILESMGGPIEFSNRKLAHHTTGLHLASWFGLIAAVDLILSNGDIEAPNEAGETPLHVAAQKGHEPIVQMLLDMDANIDAKNKGRRTPLHCAACHGQEAVVQMLLDRGADIEAVSTHGYTPLHHAALYGYEEIARLLLDRGADIEAVSTDGYTSLHFVAQHGHEEIAQLLLDRGADIEAVSTHGRTPLYYAAEHGREAVVQMLLNRGANTEAVKGFYGLEPLLIAASSGYEAIVQLLLDKGANVEVVTRVGYTPLIAAASGGFEAIIQQLLDRGANIEVTETISGMTPLLHAARTGCQAGVQMLLNKGANIEATGTTSGMTPLLFAAQFGREAVAQLLLDRGANIEATETTSGMTPLLVAAKFGREAVAQLLLDRGANIEVTETTSGMTPLLFAAKRRLEALAQQLLDRGVNIEATETKSGRTPLLLAAKCKCKYHAQKLRDRDAVLKSYGPNLGRSILRSAEKV